MIMHRNECYTHYFLGSIGNDFAERFESIAKIRRKWILEKLGLKTAHNTEQTSYIVKFSGNKYGRFRKNLIYCEFDDMLEVNEPFMHEECHDVTYRYWGIVPNFLFEGIAEYLLFLYLGKEYYPIQKRGRSKGQALNELEKLEPILLNNIEHNRIPDMKETYYYSAARSFVSFLFFKNGTKFVSEIFQLYSKKEYIDYYNSISREYANWLAQERDTNV